MISGVVLAFLLVLAASFLIYIVGRRLAPRSGPNESAVSSYACGEKALPSRVKVSVSLYKYLIYFIVVDSAVILIAFSSLALRTINVLVFMLYLGVVLVSSLLLVRGGD